MILNQLGIVCALGDHGEQVWQRACNGESPGMHTCDLSVADSPNLIAGHVDDACLPALAELPKHHATRNNQLAAAALAQLMPSIERCKAKFGADRVGVIIGTSTSGIREGEAAIRHYDATQALPEDFHYSMQEMTAPADFIAEQAGVHGPCYSISIACSSSARALISAHALLLAQQVDAVIVGGVDSLCRLTLNGFHALESTAAARTLPFSQQRDGINIGEAAALFIATREPLDATLPQISLSGFGHSSDAYHMTAPEPQGRGAQDAMQQALRRAQLSPAEISYVNLHGTGTPLNDAMEAQAVTACGLATTPASATKALTGHTLGAAGAVEAALCWLALQQNDGRLPLHVYDGVYDPELPQLQLVTKASKVAVRHCLSNSFAFGGNNVSLIFSLAAAMESAHASIS